MIRNLTRRLKQLEDQLTPPGEPLVIEVRFISAETREIVNRLAVTCNAALGGRGRGRRPWQQRATEKTRPA
jgi:hypothetical protein